MESLQERIARRILEHKKDVDETLLEEIKDKSRNFREFKDNLIEAGIVSEEEILLILSREYNMPYLDLAKYRISPENKELLPKELAMRYRVLPLSRIGEVLTLATANPLDVIAVDDLRLATSFKKIDLVLAREDKIRAALDNLYSEVEIAGFLDEDSDDVSLSDFGASADMGIESVIKESKLPPIVRVVDLIIYEGLRRQASDIHIEPTEDSLVVRYRIDGVLHQGLVVPKNNQSAITARLKVMSSLNITEFRVPQDGRFKVKFEGRTIDFRVSSLPTQFGEKIVLRILDRRSLSTGLESLGFSEAPLRLFEEALAAPFGIILVTGPTGSGKSTTLYSIITRMNTPDKNIITIEDPVEYQVEGITQIQVKPEIGFTFASCLRSVLRQSPDVIMVGEIRDAETADIAIKASLTGELIFSTLHTNNSVGAITRLIDMGVEPFLVGSSLIATTAQRLIRKLCPQCKVAGDVEERLRGQLGLGDDEELFRPAGCNHCNRTGYRGRTALLEVLLFDDQVREMVSRRASEEDIIRYARSKGVFTSLKDDGACKCRDGVTSVEEVLRVAG